MKNIKIRKHLPEGLEKLLDDFIKFGYKHKHYNFYHERQKYITPCDEPILGIGQSMRSGGNLLKRLFDNHTQIRAYPTELLFSVFSEKVVSDPYIKMQAQFPIYKSLLNYNKILTI